MRQQSVDRLVHKSIKLNSTHTLKQIKAHKFYYLLIAPGVIYFFIFHYLPMFGIIVAFKDVSPFEGISGIIHNSWVGFKHFERFFSSIYFWNVLGNTLIISFYKLLFGFPAPIILALMINEVRLRWFKKSVQTISYLPHFISAVVVTGMIQQLLTTNGGLVNELIKWLGGEAQNFLGSTSHFRSVLVASDVWQGMGWGSILYLAAMTGIDPQLYEAAKIDGAGKRRQIWHITLPGIVPVIVILLIYNIGGLLNAGFEQILLLYSPAVYQVADIIDTYVYREGLTGMQYSYSAAVGLFKNVLALLLILGANYTARIFNQNGIW